VSVQMCVFNDVLDLVVFNLTNEAYPKGCAPSGLEYGRKCYRNRNHYCSDYCNYCEFAIYHYQSVL